MIEITRQVSMKQFPEKKLEKAIEHLKKDVKVISEEGQFMLVYNPYLSPQSFVF